MGHDQLLYEYYSSSLSSASTSTPTPTTTTTTAPSLLTPYAERDLALAPMAPPMPSAPSSSSSSSSSALDSYYSDEIQRVPFAPVAPPRPDFEYANGLKLKNMNTAYDGEDKDASGLRGGPSNWQKRVNNEDPDAPKLTSVTTQYMSPEERQATAISSNNGKLVDSSGALLDTTNASGIGTFQKEGANKHIFAMTGDKQICTADPWAEKKIEPTDQGANLAFVNHSSFTGGKAVAGAGEMRVEQGELQQVSDQSGHYKPDGQMMGQTLDQLNAMGVNMDKASLKLVGKDKDHKEKPLYVSPQQFQQHDAATAEAEIRAEKAKFQSLMMGAVDARKNRLGVADSIDVKDFAKNDQGVVSEVAPITDILEGSYEDD
jgi:hypothetical protein